jgi:hypothetical protein
VTSPGYTCLQKCSSYAEGLGNRFLLSLERVIREHYKRIANANLHFATAQGTAGWMTDRGRIYVIFGPPDELDVHPKGDAGRGVPYETWRYRYIEGIGYDIFMQFVDPSRRVRISSQPGTQQADYVPGYSELPIPNRHLQLPFAQGNQEVQTLPTKARSQPLAYRVRLRRSHWRPQNLQTQVSQTLVDFRSDREAVGMIAR